MNKYTNDGIPCRYILAIMAFFGLMFEYMLRVNLSVTIVFMAGGKNDSQVPQSECAFINSRYSNGTDTDHKPQTEFDWDEELQGLLLGAFFWGYIIPQVWGGRLAERYGGKQVLGFGMLVCIIFSLLSPVAARTHVGLFFACRIIIGLGQGVVQPALHTLLGSWAPPNERSRISTMSYTGQQFGVVVGLPLAGYLCKNGFDRGWPSVFYIFGILSLIWYLAWLCLVYNSPSDHPRISLQEKHYIETSLGTVGKTFGKPLPMPWKAVFTSKALWAIIIAHMGQNWGFYTLLTQLPSYMKNILGVDIEANGGLSALPYLLCWIMGNIYSQIADTLIKKQVFSVGTVRKIFNSLGVLGPAACLVAISFIGCSFTGSVSLLIVAGGFNAAVFVGYLINHIDIAKNYAGTLQGVTNSIATIPGILAPYTVGALTKGNQTPRQWFTIFYISAAIYIVSAVVYIIMGSGENQPWNEIDDDLDLREKDEKKEGNKNAAFVPDSFKRIDVY